MFADHGWQLLRRFDAQLLVDIEAPEHYFNIVRRYPKLLCQESNHMVGCPAANRSRGNAHLELVAFGLADGILVCARRAENIQYQDFAIPGAKRIDCQSFAPRVAFGFCFGL